MFLGLLPRNNDVLLFCDVRRFISRFRVCFFAGLLSAKVEERLWGDGVVSDLSRE